MRNQLENRLQELKDELDSGQKVLADLEAKQASVRSTLLRISGAIQVLEEELSKADGENNGVVPHLSDTDFEKIVESSSL